MRKEQLRSSKRREGGGRREGMYMFTDLSIKGKMPDGSSVFITCWRTSET